MNAINDAGWVFCVSVRKPVFHRPSDRAGYMVCGLHMRDQATRNRAPTASEKCQHCDGAE